MCMADDSDGYVTMLGKHEHVARKEHRCRECHRTIRPGERYVVERYIWEREPWTHKTCAHCLVVRDWLQGECGGWLFNGLAEDISEHAASGFYGFGLRRLNEGISHRWTRKNGKPWPIPRLPKVSGHAKESP